MNLKFAVVAFGAVLFCTSYVQAQGPPPDKLGTSGVDGRLSGPGDLDEALRVAQRKRLLAKERFKGNASDAVKLLQLAGVLKHEVEGTGKTGAQHPGQNERYVASQH